MAWPTYPYTNVTEAISGFNFSSDQVYHIINDDENSLIAAETGTIPSFRNLQKQIKQAYGTLNNRGDWATATSYAVNDITKESGSWYLCLESHISGTFATDVSSGYWQVLQNITGILVKSRDPRQIATEGQTVFTLASNSYIVGVNNITIIVNGVLQFTPEDFTETNSTTITFTSGLTAGDKVDFYINDNNTSFETNASNVSYPQSPSNNVAGALDYLQLSKYTTAQIEDITHDVNVTYKDAGRVIYNTTTGLPLFSAGSAAGSTWNDALGTVKHTPV